MRPSVTPSQRTGSSVSSASQFTQISPASGAKGSEPDARYIDIVGKLSGWYHGARYSVDELWTAVSSKDSSTVSKCLKAGLSVNYCRWVQDKSVGNGVRSIADVVAIRNDAKSMRLLIENHVDLSGAVVSSLSKHLYSRAHFQHNIKTLQVEDDDLWTTPLHEACRYDRLDMIDILLGEGRGNPDVLDNKQRTSLFLATKLQKPAIARHLLLRGANIELGKGDIRPLANAAYAGSSDVVKLLLEHGAWNDAVDLRGETALHKASMEGQKDIITILAAHGADVNARNSAGVSPFFLAASEYKIDAMNSLIKCGADVDCPDANGCTALLRAVFGKNMSLLVYLLNRGADIDQANYRGWSPLYAAMIHGEDHLTRFLLTNGCDLSRPDQNGNSPLHLAAMLDSTVAIRHILTARPSSITGLSQENLFCETPLAVACKYDHSSVIKVLLKHGANAQHRDTNGLTALDRAMYHGSYACARLLLQANAEVNYNVLQSLQQGLIDHPNSNGYIMTRNLLQQRYGVTNLPNVAPSTQLQHHLAATITHEELIAQMRTMQKKVIATNSASDSNQQDGSDDPFKASEAQLSSFQVINQTTALPQLGASTAVKVGAMAGAAVGEVVLNQVASTILGL